MEFIPQGQIHFLVGSCKEVLVHPLEEGMVEHLLGGQTSWGLGNREGDGQVRARAGLQSSKDCLQHTGPPSKSHATSVQIEPLESIQNRSLWVFLRFKPWQCDVR